MSDPYNPELVDSIKTDGDASAVSTMNIGVKMYALVTDKKGLKIRMQMLFMKVFVYSLI